jgi:amino acid permease
MAHGQPDSTARVFVPLTETSIAAIFQGVSMGKCYSQPILSRSRAWQINVLTLPPTVSVSYTGHMAYLPLMHEMIHISDFPKALAAAQIFTTTMYSTVALVVYRYAGASVPSPALSAAGQTVATISYGLAAPTIVIAGVITGVVAAKMVNSWNPFRMKNAGDELHAASKEEVWAWQGIGQSLLCSPFPTVC